MVREALHKLANSPGMENLPLARDEIRTLAKRHREAIYGSDRKKERLAKYSAHLSRIHGDKVVAGVTSQLTDINNRIAYEEK